MQDRRGIIADYTMCMLYVVKQFVYNAVPLHELIYVRIQYIPFKCL